MMNENTILNDGSDDDSIFHTYKHSSDAELFEVIIQGEENLEDPIFGTVMSILTHRGHDNRLTVLLEKTLSHYPDELLIEIMESEEGSYGEETKKVVENILEDRGYEVVRENEDEIGTEENIGNETPEIDTIVEQDADILPISNETSYDIDKKKGLKIYTLTDVKMYNDKSLLGMGKTIPKGSLISYQRHMIRHGRDIIKLKTEGGDTKYVEYDPDKVHICDCYRVIKKHADIVLVSFEDFEKYKKSNNSRLKKVLLDDKNLSKSSISRKEKSTLVRTVSYLEKRSNDFSVTQKIEFDNEISDNVKIGRLFDGDIFYRVGSEEDTEAKKIILSDGREAILLSEMFGHEIYTFGLVNLFATTATLLFFLLIFIPIWQIYINSGWIVYIGIIYVPIAFILAKIISSIIFIPIDQLMKRL